jgi:hypothetical protein
VRYPVAIVICAIVVVMAIWSGAHACPCTAVAGPDSATVCRNESVYFDGSQSRPVHVKFEWDFDGGNLQDPEKTTTDKTPGNVTWDDLGVKTVTLNVVDDDDLIWDFADDTCIINVIQVNDIEMILNGEAHIVTGQNIVLLSGSTYKFKIIKEAGSAPGYPYGPSWYWNDNSTQAYVGEEYYATGNSGVLKLKYCPIHPPMTATVKVVGPVIDQVGFTGGNHTIKDIANPVWKRENSPNNPASYTKGARPNVTGKYWASDSLTYSTTVTVKASVANGCTFADKPGVSWQTWPSSETDLLCNAYLGTTIGIDSPTIAWEYKVPTGTNSWIGMGNSGEHTIYRVYDSPKCAANYYTKSNIGEALSKAAGGDEPSIALSANGTVNADLYAECLCTTWGFQQHFDAAMGRYFTGGLRGMCCCRANGLNSVLEVLGIGPYTQVFCNEKPEASFATNRHRCAGYCSWHGAVTRAYFDGWWNKWEGAIRSGGTGTTCYAPAGRFNDTYDGIADNWAYSWHWGNGQYQVCGPECTVIGYDGCETHDDWWGRFEE